MGIQVISFRCVLKNRLGRILSSTFNQDVITQSSGPRAPLGALAEGLRNLHKGERREIFLRADQAYGFYDPEKVITRFREEIPDVGTLRIGDQVIVESSQGARTPYRVIELLGDRISLDGNHPLAGQDLIFEIEAVDAREATPEEISESNTSAPIDSRAILH
ncbi:MAG: peptidylprolyl isomerase [Bdellovibrionaceae bacterium]|nr:peptidylprolyl isomerase [Pseudobdellovibrionaceae bacterium]